MTVAKQIVLEGSRIEEGRSGRIERLKNQFNRAMPSICVERALAFTNSHKKTEGQPLIVRRAKAFREACENIPVIIFDDELVVGTPGAMQRPGPLCPEMSWRWLEDELDTIQSRQRDPYRLTEEQKDILKNEIFPYWKGKCAEEAVLARLPEETKRLGIDSGVIDSEIKWRSGVAEITPDFQDIIFVKGFKGIKEEAEGYLRVLEPASPENWEKIHFYEAIIEVCEGIMRFAGRYAGKAAEMAAREADETRKQELKEISEICRWVPEHPPRSFWEAIQTVWFVQLGCVLSENGPAFNPGRFDQYMYPYYEEDIRNGVITKERAQELIECLWIKLSEWIWLLPENGAHYYAGYNSFQNLTIGGRKKDGSDGTNELSYMCLKATEDVRLPQPALSVRMHPSTPEEFLRAVCKLVRVGTGFPAIHNDQIGEEMMMYAGLPPEEARDWNLLGCVVPHQRKVGEWTDAGDYNMAAAMEYALNDGRSRITGEQMGLHTGDPTDFKTFEQCKEAFFRQLRYLIKHAVICTVVEENVHLELMPRVFASAIVEGCLEKGLDLSRGGARFNVGPGWNMIGLADGADSMAAIKKMVFEEGKLTMAQLCQALDHNFEGYEGTQQILLRCPKYGNDDDYVDKLAVEASDFVEQEVRKNRDWLGNKFHTAAMGLTQNIICGKVVGALPSGRKALTPTAEGCSPHAGMDVTGPTACMRTLAKINHENLIGGSLLNLKFSPSALEGENGISGLASLIRAYFDLGGYHVQFNVVDVATLRDAQEHPENYQNMLVRVAGYSARFVTLARDVQDEIIARMTHQAI